MFTNKLLKGLAMVALLIASTFNLQAQSSSEDLDTKAVAMASNLVDVIASCDAPGGVASLKGQTVQANDSLGIYTCKETMGADSTTLILVGDKGKEMGTAIYHYTIGEESCTIAGKGYGVLKNLIIEKKNWKHEDKTEDGKLTYTLSDDSGVPRVMVVIDSEKMTMTLVVLMLCG
ncbi:MAG: hypothetical protein RL660_893 [Bacteroidota bacterium]|jgi:hypothetical protein